MAGLVRDLQDPSKEKFLVLTLDHGQRITGFEVVAMGSVHEVYRRPMEVFRSSVVLGASAFLCVHNHRARAPTPGPEDFLLTRKLAKVAGALGLRFLDHVLVGRRGHYSFAASGAVDLNPPWEGSMRPEDVPEMTAREWKAFKELSLKAMGAWAGPGGGKALRPESGIRSDGKKVKGKREIDAVLELAHMRG